AYKKDATFADLIQYDQALLTVHYSVAQVGSLDSATDPTTGEEILYTENFEPTVEYQELDHLGFAWGSELGPTLTEHEAPSRARRGMNLVRSVFNAPVAPGAVLTLIGKTNKDAYTSEVLGITFDPETLLWVPPTSSRTVVKSGPFTSSSKGYNFVFKMAFKES